MMLRKVWLMAWMLAAVALAAAGQPQETDQAKEASDTPRGFRYAEIKLDVPIVEVVPDAYLFETEAEVLHEVVGRLERAKGDRTVRGVIVKVGSPAIGWGKAQEIRRALAGCRQAGKDVICFMDGGSNLDYYVASAADRVIMPPGGSLFLVGLRAEVLFFKGLLDKIGVKGDFIQIGESKGAAEPFTRTTSSQGLREALDAMLDDYYDQLVEGIASGRGMEPGEVEALIEKGPFTAPGAKDAGLVDDLKFYDELVEGMKKHEAGPFVLARDYGKTARSQAGAGTIGPQQFFGMLFGGGRPPSTASSREPAIAVIHAVGIIMREESDDLFFGESVISAPRLIRTIRKAREQGSTKAIVLRVDSPGGSAEASDLIWHELRVTDQVKPVIVSLCDVAASGGYYIATGGRTIYANSGTITGSIGVVGGKFVLAGLFDKIGVSVDVFERGGNAGLFSSVSEFSDSQRQRVRELMIGTYETFLQRISTSRNQSVDELRELAQGQTLTGLRARRHKLVDEVGGLSEAVAAAREAAGIAPEAKVRIIHLPRPRSLFEVLLWGQTDAPRTGGVWQLMEALPEDLGPLRSHLRALWHMQREQVAALMPAPIQVR